jgi:hypothetical protein
MTTHCIRNLYSYRWQPENLKNYILSTACWHIVQILGITAIILGLDSVVLENPGMSVLLRLIV